MKIKNTFFTFVTTLMILGCKKNTQSSTINYVGLKVYDPVYVAYDKGFFEQNNVDVKIVDLVAGGATVAQMISQNDAQGGLLSTPAIINAVNSGLSIIGVADIQSAFKEYPLEEFYVRKDSNIKSVNDLKGKKIAINLIKSSFHYTWEFMLKDIKVNYVTISFAEQEKALENGLVDAIGLMQPYTKSARENPNLIKLFDAVDCFGEKQFCEIIMNKDFIKNNEELASNFVTTIAQTCEWIMQNQEESKTIISKYTGIDVKYIDDYKFQPYGSIDLGSASYWLEYMKENENISETLTVNDIVTNKYNLEAK